MKRSISILVLFFISLGISPLSIIGFSQELISFQHALPGYKFQFPRDFFSHDDFKIEWWYYTGNLKGKSGHRFGYQLTFFRFALDETNNIKNSSRWKIDQIFFAHMAVTDISSKRFFFFERINRKAMHNSGALSDQLVVWNEDWILTEESDTHHLKALQSGTGIDLSLIPMKNLIIHGKEGISQKGKGKGNASHYFSYTQMDSKGRIWIKNKEYQVTGRSWMDHEFSSNQLNKNQVGWDWFSIKLDNDIEIMLYQIRLKNGAIEPFSSGTLVNRGGSHRRLDIKEFRIIPTDYWTSKNTQVKYPSRWEIDVLTENIHLKITPDVKDQELFGLRSISGYWEGSVSISGHYKGRPIKGNGYVELVGYDKALDIKSENK